MLCERKEAGRADAMYVLAERRAERRGGARRGEEIAGHYAYIAILSIRRVPTRRRVSKASWGLPVVYLVDRH